MINRNLIEKVAKAIAAEKVQSFDWHDHIMPAMAAIEEVYKHLEVKDAKDQVPAKEANQGMA